MISISLKSVDGLKYETTAAALQRVIGNEASSLSFFAESDQLGQNNMFL